MSERQREPRHEHQVRVALKRGRSNNAETNTHVYYEEPVVRLMGLNGLQDFKTPGGFRELLTLNGPTRFMTGHLHFFHHDVEVLTVNFDQGWITDRGYSQYSLTTQRNIDGWMDVLRQYLPTLPSRWHRWTTNWRHRHPVERMGRKLNNIPEPDELLVEFRDKAPWLQTDDRYAFMREKTWKFYWHKYDAALADAFWYSKDFLASDLNRRYFTYGWAADTPSRPLPHHWVRRFISDSAERRWRNRERRNGRPCPRT